MKTPYLMDLLVLIPSLQNKNL